MKSRGTRYEGACFCGAVGVAAEGEPFAMGFCHCRDCRAWSAAPVNAFALWPRDAVRVTRGNERLATHRQTEASHRRFCTRCGGHVMTDHPGAGFTDVYAGILPTLEFRPEVHVNYASAVLGMDDGLPKFRDVPAEMGGSGERIEDDPADAGKRPSGQGSGQGMRQ